MFEAVFGLMFDFKLDGLTTVILVMSCSAFIWSIFSVFYTLNKSISEENKVSTLEAEIFRLRKQLRFALSGDVKLKTRIKRLESSFGQVKRNTVEIFKNAKDKHALKLAKTLMSRGANTGDLVELCGLSRSEANILKYMEQHKGERLVAGKKSVVRSAA